MATIETFNQMKKHILVEHPIAGCRWKNVNLVLVANKQLRKIQKKIWCWLWAIAIHFGNIYLYKKDDA